MQQPPTTSTPLSGGSFGNLGGSHGFGSASGIGRGAPTYTLNTSTLNAGPSPLGSTNVAGSTSGSNGSHSAKVLSNLLGTSGPVSTGHSGAAAGAGTSIGNTAGLTQADMSSLHYLLSSPAPPTSGSMSGVSSVLHSGSQQLHTNLGASALQALGAAYNKNGSATNNGGGAGTGQARGPGTEEDIYTLVLELFNPTAREQALSELSKKRDQFEDLALVLWNSYGIMAIILQEIIMVYPLLHSSALSVQASNRVCNALALLQLVAAHPETRQHLIHANIPQFLYP
ncbi:RNA-binding protein, CCR4-NOT complex subunit Rcd1, partial [Dispira parvispora]